MGSFNYPHICYGWIEPNNKKEIDCETLEEISMKYDLDFRAFCTATNHFTQCNSFYGIICNLDSNTGTVDISNEEKNKILEIYKLWERKNNIDVNCKIDFKLTMSGEFYDNNIEYYTFELE